MVVKVYGASDDLVEVEGGALTDEFGAYDRAVYLHFNEGTVLRVEYKRDGVWHIERVKTGTAEYSHKPAPQGNEDDYSDQVELRGDLTSVECWDRVDGPSKDALVEKCQDYDDWRRLSLDELKSVWSVIKGK